MSQASWKLLNLRVDRWCCYSGRIVTFTRSGWLSAFDEIITAGVKGVCRLDAVISCRFVSRMPSFWSSAYHMADPTEVDCFAHVTSLRNRKCQKFDCKFHSISYALPSTEALMQSAMTVATTKHEWKWWYLVASVLSECDSVDVICWLWRLH